MICCINIFNFVDELLEIQPETHIKLRTSKQKKKSTLEKEQHLREQTSEFNSSLL